MDNQEITEVVESQPSEVVETPAPEPTLAEKIQSKVGEVTKEPVIEAPPAFEPNFKFKANKKEHEVPEMLRSIIKDKDSEKYVKDILERSHGIESMREALKHQGKEFNEVRSAYSEMMGTYDVARQAYQRDDMDGVFSTLKISPEKVLQWAVEKVQLSQLPPDQRALHESRQDAQRRAWDLERQQSFQSQQQVQTQSQYISQMLDLVLERQDVSSVAQTYDSRKGQEGAFRGLVKQMGESEFAMSGKVLTPMEAVQRAVELLGEQMPQRQQNPVQAQVTQTQQQPQQVPKKTLPSVGSTKATAPAKSKIKSLDDLHKARAAIMDQ